MLTGSVSVTSRNIQWPSPLVFLHLALGICAYDSDEPTASMLGVNEVARVDAEVLRRKKICPIRTVGRFEAA